MNHVIIEGFMGSGKGAVGRKVAEMMNLPLIDTDKRIAEKLKMTPQEAYERFGEVFYRAEETFLLHELEHIRERSVMIIGSGLPTMPQNDKYLRELGTVYYLKATIPELVETIERTQKKDWMEEKADLRELVEKLLMERTARYEAVANVVIETTGKSTGEIADEIIKIAQGVRKEAPVKKKKAARKAKAESEEKPEENTADAQAEAPDTEEAAVPEMPAEEVPEAAASEEAVTEREEPVQENSAVKEEEAPAEVKNADAEPAPKKKTRKKTAKKTTEDGEQ